MAPEGVRRDKLAFKKKNNRGAVKTMPPHPSRLMPCHLPLNAKALHGAPGSTPRIDSSSSVSVGNGNYTYTHARPYGLVTRMKTGNNQVVNYTYDALERPATVTYNYSINYDESGVPYAFDYNGTIYYYITNLQDHVIAIVDSSGGIVGTYKYDAWGAIVAITDTDSSGTVKWS